MFVDGLTFKAFRINVKSPRTVHVFLCVAIRFPEDLSRFGFVQRSIEI